MVFADRAKLDALNAIVHPRVKAEIVRQFAEWARDGKRAAAFVEAALLVEAGYLDELDGLVVAWSRPEQQVERLRARGMSEEEARRRIAAQMPVEEKLKFATEKIDCSGTMEETRRQVEGLAARIRARCEQIGSGRRASAEWEIGPILVRSARCVDQEGRGMDARATDRAGLG